MRRIWPPTGSSARLFPPCWPRKLGSRLQNEWTRDSMLTMAPPPARRMAGTAALIPRNAPVRPMFVTVCHISSVWSSKLTRKLAPALLHSIVKDPNVFLVLQLLLPSVMTQ